MMSATQTNAKAEEVKGIKDETCIRGSRAIADKCDIGMVTSFVTQEELDLLKEAIEETGLIPNQVTDLYKNRRGRFNKIRIWSNADLGNCRKEDLFITDAKYKPIDSFQIVKFAFEEYENSEEINILINGLNDGFLNVLPKQEEQDDERIDLIELQQQEIKSKGLFGDLI